MNEAIRKAFPRHRLLPLVHLLARTGITPNALTWIGLIICTASGVLAGAGLLPAAGLVSLIGGGFDMFDGALARAMGRTSRFGALLDSTLDRYGEAVLLLGLLVYAASRGSVEQTMLIGLSLVGSFMVSYVRARAEGLGLNCEVGMLTRPERVILLGVALLLYGLFPVALLGVLAIMAVLTNVTAGQRLWYVWRQLEKE